jgi:hypothetical protein
MTSSQQLNVEACKWCEIAIFKFDSHVTHESHVPRLVAEDCTYSGIILRFETATAIRLFLSHILLPSPPTEKPVSVIFSLVNMR